MRQWQHTQHCSHLCSGAVIELAKYLLAAHWRTTLHALGAGSLTAKPKSSCTKERQTEKEGWQVEANGMPMVSTRYSGRCNQH